jgi:hypothetical protein
MIKANKEAKVKLSNKTLTIKKKSIELNIVIDRAFVKEVVETPDGISFDFKNGCSFFYENQYMSSGMKNRMSVADRKFQDHNLVYDLDNPAQPVLVIAE